MAYFVDLHIHSRFARATSPQLTLTVLDEMAQRKGIHLLGTGDSTHPRWFAELQSELVDAPESGLYMRAEAHPSQATRFLPSVEIACIYRQAGRNRRIHLLVCFPSLTVAAQFNKELTRRGANLESDGRPIVGLSCKAVAQLAFALDPTCLVIPAHVWTPWFGLFGSMSGFDSLEACFEELAPRILAIETGLSSDPPMNWRWSALDNLALVSFSDAHSPAKLGRELTQLEGELSYPALREALGVSAPVRYATKSKAAAYVRRTIEFFPEEGKYHLDGHRAHQVRWTPAETNAHHGICTECSRPVTVGVLSRIAALADRPVGFRPQHAPDFVRLLPLNEVIASALEIGSGTKKVAVVYEALIKAGGNEHDVLLNMPRSALAAASTPRIAQAIMQMRKGQVVISPGYDGQFGTVSIQINDSPVSD